MVEIFFDIETKKLFDQIENRDNLPDLGVSIVSLYRRKRGQNLSENEGEMRSFWEADFSQISCVMHPAFYKSLFFFFAFNYA